MSGLQPVPGGSVLVGLVDSDLTKLRKVDGDVVVGHNATQGITGSDRR